MVQQSEMVAEESAVEGRGAVFSRVDPETLTSLARQACTAPLETLRVLQRSC